MNYCPVKLRVHVAWHSSTYLRGAANSDWLADFNYLADRIKINSANLLKKQYTAHLHMQATYYLRVRRFQLCIRAAESGMDQSVVLTYSCIQVKGAMN